MTTNTPTDDIFHQAKQAHEINLERLSSPYVFNRLEEAQYHNKMQDVRIRDLENIVDLQWKVILAIGLTSLINLLSGMIL